jgi:hypothetical protein
MTRNGSDKGDAMDKQLIMWQYWVVYAFFTVIESAINAVYWFPFYYTFKFVFIIWLALPQTGYAIPTMDIALTTY